MKTKSRTTPLEFTEICINTINHVLIGTVAIYMTWLCIRVDYDLFNLHVIFTTLGYQLLMCEAILALYSGNVWSGLLQRRTKSKVHLVLQILGSSLALSGVIIELYIKKWVFKWTNNHAIFGK